jgi:LysM repeat protein
MVRLARIAGLTPKNRLTSTFVFQTPPLDEAGWSGSADHAEWDAINHRRYSNFTVSGLRTVTVTTMLVDYKAWFHHTQPPAIHDQIEELRQLMDRGVVFRLRVSNRKLWDVDDVNMAATIRSMSVSERGGENDARYVTLEMSEFRETEMAKQARRSKAEDDDTIDIKDGMTLWNLSVKYTRRGSDWKKLAKLNGITGVRAHDDLLKWAKKHGRKTLKLPPAVIEVGGTKVGSGLRDAVRG